MNNLFDIKSKVVVITGGYGVLGASMARYLNANMAKVIILGRDSHKGQALVSELSTDAMFVEADVLDEQSLESAKERIVNKWGRIDGLINAAGGNMPGATIASQGSLFDMKISDMYKVVDLNYMGTVKSTLVFGECMAHQGNGSVINISSMAAIRSITRVVGYSAAKAAVDNFTRWCAMELAHKYGDGIRVNAIAPGFFITEQNRSLLTNDDGTLTDRAQKVIRQTPFGRMGRPDELNGAIHYLISDASSFVTGTVLPIDGGFSIFSGV